MKKNALFVFMLSIFFSCDTREGYIEIHNMDYCIEHSSAPYDVYFYLNVSHYGEPCDLKVKWDFGDGTESNELMPLHTYTQDKKYKVKLSLKNFSAISVEVFYIDFSLPHKAGASFSWSASEGNPHLYAPVEVKFYNFSKFADGYLWDFGDSITSNEPELYHIYEEPGPYNVTLTVYSGQDSVQKSELIWVKSPYK